MRMLGTLDLPKTKKPLQNQQLSSPPSLLHIIFKNFQNICESSSTIMVHVVLCCYDSKL